MSDKWVPMVPADTMSVWTFFIIMAFLIAIVGVFGWFLYWSKHTRFQIQDSQLVIEGGLYSRTIALSAIDEASMGLLDYEQAPALKPRMRVKGIGLSGYKSGWYKLMNDEKALLHISDESSMLAFKVTGEEQPYWVFMSIAEPEDFVLVLRHAIRKD